MMACSSTPTTPVLPAATQPENTSPFSFLGLEDRLELSSAIAYTVKCLADTGVGGGLALLCR